MTKCLIECLITYFYYLTDDYVVRLFCHLSDVYRELLEPSLINRVLILDCLLNTIPHYLALKCSILCVAAAEQLIGLIHSDRNANGSSEVLPA